MSAIRHLAASYSGNVLAAGEFEKRIHIFDLVTRTKICEFESRLDFGGRRLAVSDDGRYCATGAYARSSISVHDTKDGTLLWKRSDLKKVQDLTFSRDAKPSLYAFLDNGDGHILDPCDGHTTGAVPDTSRRIDSPYGDYACVVHDKLVRVIKRSSGEEVGRRERINLNEVAFTDRYFVNTEFQSDPTQDIYAYNPSDHKTYIVCHDLRDMSERWRIERYDQRIQSRIDGRNRDGVFEEIGYSAARKQVLCIFWAWTPKESMRKDLLYIDPDSGDVVDSVRLNDLPPVCAFANRDRLLITSDGQIIDTTDGETRGILQMPPARQTMSKGGEDGF